MTDAPRALRTAARLLLWLTLLVLAFVTLSPMAFRPETPFGPNAERFAAFLVVSTLAMLAYPRHRLPLFFVLVAVAAVLEASQNLVGERHGRTLDFVVKAFGIFAGIGVTDVFEGLLDAMRPRPRLSDGR